ncbi:hypothetical protein C0992_002676 [Termitomyces sp. T32_za158]|nr:hypothetical protein C0992_002676 [Termitomyces sp. T32_za158]
MSSSTASIFLISPAVLATWTYVPKLDLFLASISNVGPDDQKTVVGAMWVFEKWLWHKGRAPEVTWSWAEELQEWCTAQYGEHAGVDWLVAFKATFAPIPPLLEDQLAMLLEDESGGLMTELSLNSKVDVYVKLLVEMELDWQAQRWAGAAKQQLVELSLEEEQALLWEQAALMVSTTAAGQVAGFLPPETLTAGA